MRLAGHAHTAFVLSNNYAVTGNKQGTVEFDARRREARSAHWAFNTTA
jgi:hypothetical protein